MLAFLLGALAAGTIGVTAYRRQRAQHDAMLLRVAIYVGDKTEADFRYLDKLAKGSR